MMEGSHKPSQVRKFETKTWLVFWVEPFEISCSDAIGEESEITDHSEIFIWDVADQSFDEIINGHRFFLKSMCGVVQE